MIRLAAFALPVRVTALQSSNAGGGPATCAAVNASALVLRARTCRLPRGRRAGPLGRRLAAQASGEAATDEDPDRPGLKRPQVSRRGQDAMEQEEQEEKLYYRAAADEDVVYGFYPIVDGIALLRVLVLGCGERSKDLLEKLDATGLVTGLYFCAESVDQCFAGIADVGNGVAVSPADVAGVVEVAHWASMNVVIAGPDVDQCPDDILEARLADLGVTFFDHDEANEMCKPEFQLRSCLMEVAKVLTEEMRKEDPDAFTKAPTPMERPADSSKSESN